MPLSEDSRALLALLLGRGKSYSDIAGLLGIDEAEVRSRAATALAEVDPSQPAPDADLTDYLLGQADAITRADVNNRLTTDPSAAAQAEALTDQLRLLVPGAELPQPGSAQGGKPRPVAAPAAAATTSADSDQDGPGTSRLSSITAQQRRLIALLVGAALLAVVVILLVTGVFGGSSDDDSTDRPKPANTVAVLEPVKGQQGTGKVQFGFAGSEFAANLNFSDLKPTGKNNGYVLWLQGSTGAFPIHAAKVNKSGAIQGQIGVMEAVICLVAGDVFPRLSLSLAENEEFTKAIEQSRLTEENQQNAKLPKFTGKKVLEGPISMPQEAKDQIIPICNGTAADTQVE